MDTKKLRQKILDLAIHGKLVPQDPNDEPASVLLERIRAEKEKLIKEGKIKAPKKSKSAGDTSHYPKEGPWELPEGWCWTTIEDISNSILYGVNEPSKASGNYKLLRITDIQKGKVDWETVPFTDYDDKKAEQYLLSDGDILFARTGATVGKSYLASNAPSNAIYASYLIRVRYSNLMCPQYVKFFFESGYYWEQISSSSVGVGQPNVNGASLGKLIIPIPPVAEQIRVAKEANKLLCIIDDLDYKAESLENDIVAAKSKILDLAVHGRLVSKNPSDEPAIDLLKRINPDFRPSDNLHYEVDLPEGWVLCTLSEASNYGQCISVPVDTIENDAWVLELEDIEKDSGRLIRKLAKTERNISGIRHRFQKGQVLYSKLRTYLNKVLLAPDDGYCTTEIVPITPIKGLDPQYLNIVLRSPYFLNYTVQCGYGVKMPRLGTNDGRKAVIPIPPIAEQHRIVNKTNQLMSELELIATLNDVKVAE